MLSKVKDVRVLCAAGRLLEQLVWSVKQTAEWRIYSDDPPNQKLSVRHKIPARLNCAAQYLDHAVLDHMRHVPLLWLAWIQHLFFN